eukprot:SAG11_NODE_31251_length_293_cov_1.257732_1_plen_34_part_01
MTVLMSLDMRGQYTLRFSSCLVRSIPKCIEVTLL